MQKCSPPEFIRHLCHLVHTAAIAASVGRKELDIAPVGKCLLTWVSAARRASGSLDPNPALFRALLDGETCIFCHRPIKLRPLAFDFKSIIRIHHADGLHEQWAWNDITFTASSASGDGEKRTKSPGTGLRQPRAESSWQCM